MASQSAQTFQGNWSQRLREHCSVRNLGQPTWQDVSDRRGASDTPLLMAQFSEEATNKESDIADFTHLFNLTVRSYLTPLLGGRTAWSSIVIILGEQHPARFWYSGERLEQAREDAAEVALRQMTGYTKPNQQPPPASYYARGQ